MERRFGKLKAEDVELLLDEAGATRNRMREMASTVGHLSSPKVLVDGAVEDPAKEIQEAIQQFAVALYGMDRLVSKLVSLKYEIKE